MFHRSKYIAIIFGFLCFAIPVQAQESFRVLFYNVENLFDCKDDSLKNDNEYLSDALRRWTPFRYRQKLNNIAKTIVASGDAYVPDLVGLCEVENDSCMRDLVRFSPLREAGYRYVMTDSPDERGIDVALLYQRGSFKLLQKQEIRIPHEQVKRGPTRNILHVVGEVITRDSLDVILCHFPSRSGGAAQSESFRRLAARVLRNTVDSLMEVRRRPSVLIMGDFNDVPSAKSIRKELGAEAPVDKIEAKQLYNLMHNQKEGTYCYRGAWETIDQFIVSGTMLGEEGTICTSLDRVQILRFPFLLEEDDKYGGMKPFRTYYGMKYQGGFSDHLPIVIDLLIRGDKDCYSE